jgi:predicted nucleic acid-binding protein
VAALFFDTSGIVKRYVVETGTAWVNALIDPTAGHTLRLARITGAEVVAAVARRRRGGSLTTAAAALALAEFQRDYSTQFLLTDVTAALITSAMSLAERYALRGYDAVQPAAAMQTFGESLLAGVPFTLVSADAELNAAAVAEGLAVEDPNAHP